MGKPSNTVGFGGLLLAAFVACGGTTGPMDGSGGLAGSGGGSDSGASGGASSGGASTGGFAAGGTETGGAGVGGGTGDCTEDCAGSGFVCCFGSCVNVGNDVMNCGTCGTECEGPYPYCGAGTCGTSPCDDPDNCTGNCCGSACCSAGQLCCDINIGPSVTQCTDPDGGTCPKGCPMCVCAAPETPIATPAGEVPIAELRLGDLVYSQEADGIVVVPITQVNRTSVRDHTVLEITLDSGRRLRISPGHPAADGRPLSELPLGQWQDGVRVQSLRPAPYDGLLTYDILPGSSTGVYFAAGLPVGSTLRPVQLAP